MNRSAETLLAEIFIFVFLNVWTFEAGFYETDWLTVDLEHDWPQTQLSWGPPVLTRVTSGCSSDQTA